MPRDESGPAIAVVGAGIAGASLAWFLRERLGDQSRIDVYEATDRIGGRLRSVSVGGARFEAGGKYLHERNRCIGGFIERFDLDREPVSRDTSRTGVWDGVEFGLTTATMEPVTLFRLLTRYGLSPRRVRTETKSVADRFDGIYDHAETAFETPEALLEAVGLMEVYTRSGREYLTDGGIDTRFVDELVAGTTRTIYGQNPTLNAVACLVALTGMGSGTYTLEAPNAELCRRLLAGANATVNTETPVERVAVGRDETRLETPSETRRYDAVCVATPAEFAAIELSGVSPPDGYGNRDFSELSVAYIAGRLDPSYFGAQSVDDVPELVVTGSDSTVEFVHLRDVSERADQPVYKLTTRDGADSTLLDALFTNVDDIAEVSWRAFPRMEPTTPLPPFRLADGLYYPNAMESVASTMETQAIAGRTVANLVARDY
ncbi:MAG: NAD(P)-binding protein [Halobacteriales archaeon]|nr:NAD(P)-binding protein [Halobacteriales archaeon]